MANEVENSPGFFERLGLAFKIMFNAEIGAKFKKTLLAEGTALQEPPPEAPAEQIHASGLFVLSTLQQEGRLIDFLQQDVASFSDEEVGAAARVVHGGCRKALDKLAGIVPVLKENEGEVVTVPAGFDAERIRLTGNITGQPPFKGSLKHHGWVAETLRFPVLSEVMDYRVIAPAEVELS
jgi:hypothetical protein